ncbi:unnamed protein product [Adineta steineri]|uniref:Ionotropic glutamate receptor C-terminal domain-containing protein n=1 Tax=Adineta steineri TaxID=433720 RepID=A0A815ALU0_9BILA|nr:unnamed protein product [Adineta steineri]CAF1549761.1 unnamed protein product [Adineta steineri]
MISLYNFRCLLLHLLFVQRHLKYVAAMWPSGNVSNIKLLGLFPDADNSTETTDLSIHSRAMFQAAVLLSQSYNITIDGHYIGWQSEQTGGVIMNALGDTCQALSCSNIVGVVGPGFSREAQQIANFGNTVGIPIISYAATDPELSDRNDYLTFYRTVPSDNSAATAIVKLFVQYNWTSCIIIYQNDPYGIDGSNGINQAFVNQGLTVNKLIIFDIATLQIQGDLNNLLTNSPSRIVILWTTEIYTSIVLQSALNSNFVGPKFTWILSTTISLTNFNRIHYPNLIGMLTVEPVTGSVVGAPINSTLLNAAYDIWKQYEPETFPASLKVSPYALFAFDATWTLIQSLQQLCSTISSPCTTFNGSSFCFDRYFINSNLLLNTINSLQFIGVSGPIGFSSTSTDRLNGTYYYVENVQATATNINFNPVLQYSDSGSWNTYSGANLVVWPGNSLTPPSGQVLLDGVTLRIGIIETPVFTIVNGGSGGTNLSLSGYAIDLIALLQTQLNFIPNIILAPANQTYAGLIEDVANGVYDIVVGDVTVTSARREIVDFSVSIFDNTLELMTRKTYTTAPDPLSFLKPFSFSLWITFLGAWICGTILFFIVERDDNEMLQNRPVISQISLSMWYCIGNCIGHGADFHVSTAPGRLLTGGLYLLSLVLVASYTANLASDLTILKTQDILSGIDDLKNGKIPPNRIGIRVGTAAVEYYLAEISNGNPNYYPLYSLQQSYDDLLAGIIDVTFTDIGVGEYITNNVYCNLSLVGAGFDPGIFGIVLPKNWIYTQQLDVAILSLGETGLLGNLQVKWFQTSICPDTSGTATAIEVGSMGGLFATFGVIIILALLLFAWKKRKNLKDCSFVPKHKIHLASRKQTFSLNHSNTISNQVHRPIPTISL